MDFKKWIEKDKFIPRKLGVRLEPPAIVYIYSESNKLRMRTMPLRDIWSTSITDFVLDDLHNRHRIYLEHIPDEKLKKMIEIIKHYKQGMKLKDILEKLENNKSIEKSITKAIESNKENIRNSKHINLTEFNSIKTIGNQFIKTNSDQDILKIRDKPENNNFSNNFSNSKRTNFSFGNSNSSSDSDEFDYEKEKKDKKSESEDENSDIEEILTENESVEEKLADSHSHNSELSLNMKDEILTNAKNDFNKGYFKRQDNIPKVSSLKDLLNLHDKIESATNPKNKKNDDDTDVEFDDSDIPLEEDFY